MLLRSDDVFDIYVEPYIHSGFRPPDQPYSYYYRSLFSLHNETCSVWIHLLGTFILIGHVLVQWSTIGCSSSIVSIYLISNCAGACLMLLCSAQAHLFHSRTVSDHLRSFYLDYFGINFYGFTAGMILKKFSHQQEGEQLINDWWYSLVLSLLSIYSLSIACFCKTFYRRPYPLSHKILQCSGVLIVYAYQISPVMMKVFVRDEENRVLTTMEENGLFWHSLQMFFFVLSGLIFVGRIPERFSPGVFDLIGQSHQAFHVTIFLMAYCQSNAVFCDLSSFTGVIVRQTMFVDLVFTLFVLLFQLFTVRLWFAVSRPTIEERYRVKVH